MGCSVTLDSLSSSKYSVSDQVKPKTIKLVFLLLLR